jgi:Plasmid encoded RepA protein
MGKLEDAFDAARAGLMPLNGSGTKADTGLMPLGDILKQAIPKLQRPQFEAATKALKPPSRVQSRLLEPRPEHESELCFQHSVLCQIGLPYRDPKGLQFWQRRQGSAALEIEAGRAFDPARGEYVNVGLPWGPKPRLVLAHLNAEALRLNSPEITVEDSLSAFVRRIRGFNGGREIRMFQTQLRCLSTATIRLAIHSGTDVSQISTHIVTGFVNLWFPKDERQRVLWNPSVRLSQEYFDSLKRHAVPLNEWDLAALAHTAMGLDIYAWLAQRLHRINPRKPAFIPWTALQEQFGPDYQRIDKFKAVFRVALAQVLSRYKSARLEMDNRGMIARNSPPPVAKRLFLTKT